MDKTEITYHGHSMFEIKSASGVKLITDPYNEKIKNTLPDVSGDIILVSHDHFDHANTSIVRGNPRIINKPLEEKVDGIWIKGIKTYHDTKEGQLRGQNIIFKFTVDGIIFVHMGDFGDDMDIKIEESLKDVDVLMIPVGGTYTINAYSAFDIVKKLVPPFVISMHYKESDSKLDIDKVDNFLNKWPGYKKVGHTASFSKNDLPFEGTEVWIFESK